MNNQNRSFWITVSLFALSFITSGHERDRSPTEEGKITPPARVTYHHPRSFGLYSRKLVTEPVKYVLTTPTKAVKTGEEFSLKIALQYFNISPSALYTERQNSIILKLIVPEGFVQTSGENYEHIVTQVNAYTPYVEFTIRGYLTVESDLGNFKLLKSDEQYLQTNTFIYKAELNVKATASEKKSVREKALSTPVTQGSSTQLAYATTASGASISCSGYSFTDGQVIGTAGPGNATVRISNGCARVYWEGGGASGTTHKNWLPQLSGKSIPDAVLSSCLTWESEACKVSCTAPAAPVIASSKSGNSTTLTASGCSGSVTWNTGQTGSSLVVTPTQTTSYSATCTVSSCTSTSSNTITVVGTPAPQPEAPTQNPAPPSQSSGNGYSCSGYSFTDGQVIGTAGPGNATVRISNGCARVYWEGGGASGTVHKNWLSQLSGKSIPDAVLSSCLTWEGEACKVSCTAPAAPVIASSKSGNSTTLTASGCSGTVTWNTGQTGSPLVVTPTQTTSYSATCSVNGCTSTSSNTITVTVETTPTPEPERPAPGVVSFTCSGYTFTDGQVIGVGGPGKVVVRFSAGCPAVFWEGGGASGRVHKNWLYQLSNKSVPDNVLGSCLKWEGEACSCIPPTPPTIASKVTGNSATLTATGCSGTVSWSTGQTGSSLVVTINAPVTYSATCTVNACTSEASNKITLQADTDAAATARVKIYPKDGINAWSIRGDDHGNHVRAGYRMKLAAKVTVNGTILITDSFWDDYRAGDIQANNGTISNYGKRGWWQSKDGNSGTWLGNKFYQINNEPLQSGPLTNVDVTGYKGQMIHIRVFNNFNRGRGIFSGENFTPTQQDGGPSGGCGCYGFEVHQQTVFIP